MRILLVIAHPLKTSLCAELARHVIAELRGAGHEVVIEDLYASGFNPVMTPEERRGYNGTSPVTGADIAEPIQHLLAAEAIVLVFPVWWFGLPAILKGWLDRVWAPDIAFDHREDAGVLTPRLTQLRHLLVIAAFGSPWWLDRFVMGRPVMKLFKRALLPSCAADCHFDMRSLHDTDHLKPP
ncbi:MAG: NAD(P)H-dependent oxidoreductase, partial [Dongiaceae bacterium]